SLLASAPGVVLSLQALEVAEGGAGRLVEQPRHGPRLLRLGEQRGVAAQHHRLVLHLVPVDPGEELGVAAVHRAVGDAAQQVGMARPPPAAAAPLTWTIPAMPITHRAAPQADTCLALGYTLLWPWGCDGVRGVPCTHNSEHSQKQRDAKDVCHSNLEY
uniref:Uncharacterized protein n=1 Tax=Terrapene triunguis TaxID=2587831 RepID=A0A674KAV7_9SAUR